MRRLLLLLIAGLVVLPVTFAAASENPEAEFGAKINSERTSRGLQPLEFDAELLAVARRHSQRMASEGRLYHNPNLANEVGNWSRLGENVGRGPDVLTIHQAFMDSPKHAAQILDAQFRGYAVGVVAHAGELWVTEIFVTRQTALAPAAPAAPRPPRTARQPVARPASPSNPAPAPAVATPAYPKGADAAVLAIQHEVRSRPPVIAIPRFGVTPWRAGPEQAALIAVAFLSITAFAHIFRGALVRR